MIVVLMFRCYLPAALFPSPKQRIPWDVNHMRMQSVFRILHAIHQAISLGPKRNSDAHSRRAQRGSDGSTVQRFFPQLSVLCEAQAAYYIQSMQFMFFICAVCVLFCFNL